MGVLFYVVLLLAVILAVLLIALLHAGFFFDLRIRTSTPLSCPKRVAYRLYTGPYKNSGAAFKQLCGIVPDLKTFGVYYDDPDKVRLRIKKKKNITWVMILFAGPTG